MTAYCQPLHQPLPEQPKARRDDLLALSHNPMSGPRSQQKMNCQLRAMGYTIAEADTGHWIVSRPDRPMEIHLYSEAELAAFITGRACAYASGFARH